MLSIETDTVLTCRVVFHQSIDCTIQLKFCDASPKISAFHSIRIRTEPNLTVEKLLDAGIGDKLGLTQLHWMVL